MFINDIAEGLPIDGAISQSSTFYAAEGGAFSFEEFQPGGYDSIWNFYIAEVVQAEDSDGTTLGPNSSFCGFDFRGLAEKIKDWDYGAKDELLGYVRDDVRIYGAELLDNPEGYERLKQLADTILPDGSGFREELEHLPKELRMQLESEIEQDYDGTIDF